jgi:hypothetical protein
MEICRDASKVTAYASHRAARDNARIARCVNKRWLASQVENFYTEMTGKRFLVAQKTAQSATRAHGLRALG